ncbi:MAG: Y-family DNA polymerase [Pseudomonadales bacterium]|nr:Y-family DNA polymerase [Pseudomonadales bacterium]
MSRLFALVDCNNFYASCERVFEPQLEGKAIVVLSNNDGCVVARSNEAKALGIAMAVPLYQIKELVREHGVVVRSSNYALYGDISQRVMAILARFSPHQEIYSIDEAFLDFTGLANPMHTATLLRNQVRQSTGIPVSVGIGKSKTQAKLANFCAKKLAPFCRDGICNLAAFSESEFLRLMANIPVAEVWGIGKRTSQQLAKFDIKTVAELIQADANMIRQQFNVLLERIIIELKGISCLDLEEMMPEKKQIVASRSFGSLVVDVEDLEGAIANHVHRAVDKLRRQQCCATMISVFINTHRFREQDQQYHPHRTVTLVQASQELCVFQKAANVALHDIYKTGYGYKKAGVMLSGIQSMAIEQADLFAPSVASNRPLMQVMEHINGQFGRGTLRTASELLGKKWHMTQNLRSPRYTTCWDELRVVG